MANKIVACILFYGGAAAVVYGISIFSTAIAFIVGGIMAVLFALVIIRPDKTTRQDEPAA